MTNPLLFFSRAWEDAPPLFMQPQKSFPAISRVFKDYFVNFKLINVIFIYFVLNLYLYCGCKEKKEKKIKNK